MQKGNISKPDLRSFIVPRDPSVDRRFRPRPERKVNLCNLISEEGEDSCLSQDTIGSEVLPESESALVYLRMRPIPGNNCSYYKIHGTTLITSQPDNSTNGKNILEKHFTFNDIFDGPVNQCAVYNSCIRSKIEAGENLTVLAYGTSGSGKTFTLLGDLENPGIIPRSMENLFKNYANNIFTQPSVKVVNNTLTLLDDSSIKNEESVRNSILSMCADVNQLYSKIQKKINEEQLFETLDIANKSVFIWISFAEIYNEVVYDLLNPNMTINNTKRKGLKVISNEGKVFIKNLTSIYVKSGLEAYKLLHYGLKRVTYASTAINTNSSRSHCIFFIDVITFSYPDIFTHNCYKFCDLAGSERLGKTGNVGSRLKEAQRINTSLMVLGRCLDAAYNNQQKRVADIIPFRESKLTFLLQTALTGKEKITMIVNITPTEQYFEENLNVLSFSSIAKNIIYKPTLEKHSRKRYSWFLSHASQTIVSPHSSIVSNSREFDTLYEENITLKSENERLSEEVMKLEKQIVQQEIQLRKELVDEFKEILEHRKKSWEKRLAQQEVSLKQIYESKMKSLEEQYKRKLEMLMQDQVEDANSSTDKNNTTSFEKENVQVEPGNSSLKIIKTEGAISESDCKKRRVTLNSIDNF